MNSQFHAYDAQGFASLWQTLRSQGIGQEQIEQLQGKCAAALDLKVDSRLSDWRQVTQDLPEFHSDSRLESGEPKLSLDGTWSDLDAAIQTLQRLHPWRKGPVYLGDLFIDTEWRSDWKWTRALPHLNEQNALQGAKVLDIGCGNAYHCWRAFGEGASFVLGVDPTRLFHYQYRVCSDLFNRYAPQSNDEPYPVHHVPLTLEDLDDCVLPLFDVVFSMGVLYHRREPQAHLKSLQKHFTPQGGKLIMETIVTPNSEPFYPEGRYAQMRNVWCLPDVNTLLEWLEEAGYQNPRLIDLTTTTLQEQRQTEWMRFYSLNQALNADNPELTIEGHPAPIRAMVLADFKSI